MKYRLILIEQVTTKKGIKYTFSPQMWKSPTACTFDNLNGPNVLKILEMYIEIMEYLISSVWIKQSVVWDINEDFL